MRSEHHGLDEKPTHVGQWQISVGEIARFRVSEIDSWVGAADDPEDMAHTVKWGPWLTEEARNGTESFEHYDNWIQQLAMDLAVLEVRKMEAQQRRYFPTVRQGSVAMSTAAPVGN